MNEKASSLHLHVEGQILIVVGAYVPNNTKSAVIGLLWLSWEDASQTWQPQSYCKGLLGMSLIRLSFNSHLWEIFEQVPGKMGALSPSGPRSVLPLTSQQTGAMAARMSLPVAVETVKT